MSYPDRDRVATAKRIAYAAPAFALAVAGIPLYLYLPKFYTDVVGVQISVVGGILLAVRLFDAVTDPLIGALSDRTRTSLGRRRPWILFASLPLAFLLAALFSPPPALGEHAATIWFGATIFLVFLFWTAVVVPYESLGPEITFDYNERTSLLALRDGVLIAGTVLAAASPAIVAWVFGLPPDDAGERAKYQRLSFFYAPLLVALCAWCFLGVRERAGAAAPTFRRLAFDWRALRANRPFLVLLAAYTVSAIGGSLPATLILYYVEYVLEARGAELYLMLYFVTGVALLPLWVAAARRIGKKAAWIASMGINTGAFLGVLFLGAGDAPAYGVLVALSGVGFGGALAIPSSMQADVIDYGELLSGERREGEYIGLWSISKKLAAAAGIGAALPILGAAGYVPNEAQTETVRLALRLLYAGVPCLCSLVGIAIALAYPIDQARHARILAAIDARRSGAVPGDPLRAD